MQPAGEVSCGAPLSFMRETMSTWDVVRKVMTATGNCGDIDWTFFGLSMPWWSLIWFVLLGLWAAAQLGKTGTDADAYSKEVVAADFEEAGDDDVLRKVVKDLSGKATEEQVRSMMQELLAEAVKQIQAGK